MRYWLTLGFVKETDQLLELARIAEELGFHGVTLADHLAMPTRFTSRYPYSADGGTFWPIDTPWPDPWVSLAAMGAVTRSLKLASNIYLAALRDPFTAARAVGTAAVLSGDRVVCGVAAGWLKEEYDLLGVDFARRGERLDELVGVMRALWTGEPTTHQGAHFSFDSVLLRPAPRQPVPVYFGGASAAALRRAATLGDGWMGLVYTREKLAPVLARLAELRAEAGRAARPFDVLIGLGERQTPELTRELEALGVTGLICSPWAMSRKDTSSLEAKRSAMVQFSERVIHAV